MVLFEMFGEVLDQGRGVLFFVTGELQGEGCGELVALTLLLYNVSHVARCYGNPRQQLGAWNKVEGLFHVGREWHLV